MLNVLNINFNDVVGGQFNNFECRKTFPDYQVAPYFCVLDKLSKDDSVTTFWPVGRLRRYIHSACFQLERILAIQSMLYPYSLQLFYKNFFRKADVVHYHILHNGWFSLLTMPLLTRVKPSVWTIHDPWLLTGHCTYPITCEGWKTGCSPCPHLDYPHALRKDNASFLFRMKKRLLNSLPVEFVVASQWMKRMVELSPIGKNLSVRVIPFGVDLDIFQPTDNKFMRDRLGIPEENLVLFFRSNHSMFKGVTYIRDALPKIIKESKRPVTILTVEGVGIFDDFIDKCQIVERLWELDMKTLAALFAASDIFLMPSTAEAFGMMAIESMACGKPVVFFRGTSLDEVTFAPRAGLGAKMNDADDLADVIIRLANDEDKRTQMGREARKLAEEHYDMKTYLSRMSGLYKELYYRNIPGAK